MLECLADALGATVLRTGWPTAAGQQTATGVIKSHNNGEMSTANQLSYKHCLEKELNT